MIRARLLLRVCARIASASPMSGATMRSHRCRVWRHAKEGAEDTGEHRVAIQTEEREARPELEPPRCNPMLREALGDVQRSLDKVEPNPDEGTVDEAVTHVVEFGAQQREEQDDAECFCRLLDNRRRQGGAQKHCSVRAKKLADLRICEQPRRLTLAPVEISQDEHGNSRKQRREEEPDQEYPHRLGVK